MNVSPLRTARPLGHSFGLRNQIAALALALVGAATLAGCAGLPGAGSASSHACADKVAQAPVSGSVPGLWACLAPEYQASLNGTGDGALVSHPFASSYALLGASRDVVAYELTLTPSAAASSGSHKLGIVVWIDAKGKVGGISGGMSPA